MKNFRMVLVVLFFNVLCVNLPAQNRGGDLEAVVGPNVTVGKQWAVFIATDQYREWGQLQYPVKDAQEIKKILLDNYYIDEIKELYNKEATASAIRNLFIELSDKIKPNDSVFVFHAGHGFKDVYTEKGAFIP
jgi:uncharacterized caspase-like protein